MVLRTGASQLLFFSFIYMGGEMEHSNRVGSNNHMIIKTLTVVVAFDGKYIANKLSQPLGGGNSGVNISNLLIYKRIWDGVYPFVEIEQ